MLRITGIKESIASIIDDKDKKPVGWMAGVGVEGLTDFGAKCEKCETINTITIEKGELRKQV